MHLDIIEGRPSQYVNLYQKRERAQRREEGKEGRALFFKYNGAGLDHAEVERGDKKGEGGGGAGTWGLIGG